MSSFLGAKQRRTRDLTSPSCHCLGLSACHSGRLLPSVLGWLLCWGDPGGLDPAGPQWLSEGERASSPGSTSLVRTGFAVLILTVSPAGTGWGGGLGKGAQALCWDQLLPPPPPPILVLILTPDFLSLKQSHYWSYVAPSSASVLGRAVRVLTASLVSRLRAAVGFCSQKGRNHLCKSTHLPAAVSFVCAGDL